MLLRVFSEKVGIALLMFALVISLLLAASASQAGEFPGPGIWSLSSIEI
jgi:hypothetical protein